MRLLLLAGSLAFALATVVAADPGTAPEAPPAALPVTANPPAPVAAPPASEAPGKPAAETLKKPEAASPAEAKPKPDPKKPEQDKRALAATYLKQCMQDWDAATHMTRKEWERTCRRVVDGRMRFMLDQMSR